MRVGVTLRAIGEKSVLWLKIAVLVVAGLMPALTFQKAEAAQLQSRSVTIDSSAIPNTDVQHLFSYTIPTSGEVEGIMYRFCDTPLGACSLPSGMAVKNADHVAQSGWAGGAFAALGTGSDVGDCDINTNTNVVCFTRTDTTSESGAVTHTISNITAPSAFQTVYVRVTLYLDADFGSGDDVDDGVVAAAYVRQLTVTGRVAERLEFCIAAIDDDDAIPTTGVCAGLGTATELAFGVIDDADVYVTPVEPTATNLSNDNYGVANINTNASGGVTLQYFPEAQTNVTASDTDQLRTFRVAPTDCSSTVTSVTDQCFRSAGATAVDFNALIGAAGQERFGMHIPCIDANDGTRSTTANMGSVPDAYNNVDNDTSSTADCENPATDAGEEFSFVDDGSVTTIASSSSVVDDEVVKLRFGVTASPTTPEGSYLVVVTYVATPTF